MTSLPQESPHGSETGDEMPTQVTKPKIYLVSVNDMLLFWWYCQYSNIYSVAKSLNMHHFKAKSCLQVSRLSESPRTTVP